MVFTCTRTEKSLMHHGIKGQHWGIRNGPPYPLDKNKIKMGGTFNNSSKPLSKDSSLYNNLVGINPEGISDNCKDLAAVGACNNYGYNLKAGNNTVKGNLHDLFDKIFKMPNAVKSMTPLSSRGEEIKTQLYKSLTRNGYAKEGDVGVVSIPYNKETKQRYLDMTGKKLPDAHAFDWKIENNNVTLGCGQTKIPIDGDHFLNKVDKTKEIEYTKVTEDMAKIISKHYETK